MKGLMGMTEERWILLCFCIPADIGECQLNLDTCHANADCIDTIGSYNCSCRSGYEGSGFNCTGKQVPDIVDVSHIMCITLKLYAAFPVF